MLKDTREEFRPFEYPEFEQIHKKLIYGYWHPDEIEFSDDVNDYRQKLTNDERDIIGRILKNFVTSEIHIGNFWGDRVASNFKKPEIQNVARYIAGQETVHTLAYDVLNTTLGLNDYHTLKADTNLYARIKMLVSKRAKTNEAILKELFLYSVMGEGVSLFSSFITIFAFTKKNLLKSIGQIVSWSALDEQLHSLVGCHLFNTFKREYELMTPELKEELHEIAREVVQIELNLIDRVFEGLKTKIINPEHIKNYVYDKANMQLKAVGLNKIFKVNKDMLKETEFFNIIINGATVQDFFASKETNYSKGIITFDKTTWEK